MEARMQENSARLKELTQKVEGLYLQPPPATPSLSSIQEECIRLMLMQTRRDVQDACEELQRGVSTHIATQQSLLCRQIWSDIQPAMKLVESVHHYVELASVRAHDNGNGQSS